MARPSSVSPAGVFVVDGLSELVLWVGAHSAPPFLESIFGTSRPSDGQALQPADSSAASAKLHALLARLREGRPQHTPLTVVVQGSPMEGTFFSKLPAEGYEGFALSLHSKVVPKL